jgi:hypothetical protein
MRRLLVVVLAGAALVIGSAAVLNAQPGPPNRFYGSLKIDGADAPIGTTVTALVNGRECGSRTTDVAGQYWVDVASSSQTPGCAEPGNTVSFRVGSRTAAETAQWNGGVFTRLDLTVSGTGAGAGAGAGAGGAGGAAQTAFSVSRMDFGGPCIPASGQSRCDENRMRLWTGDQAAWEAEFARQGRPAPSPDDVFLATYEYRIGAFDPAAIRSLAQGLGWPKVYITAIRYRGTGAGEADEYIEITNVGGAPQDMTGWRARAVESGTDFFFTEGTVLEPGATCRFYTNQTQADSCPGTINVSTSGVWNNTAGSAELWYDPLALLADSTRYSADPNNQPPPPNLRGVALPVG